LIKLVVITGLSGSGKTLALRGLEDLGYFSIDNLPVPFILPFVDLLGRGHEQEPKGAFVVDVRDREGLASFPEIVEALREREDVDLDVVFLEADPETLLNRFSESRRPHPLAYRENITVSAGIEQERRLLEQVRELSDRIVPTDDLSPHDLRRMVMEALEDGDRKRTLHVQVISFGFKHGLPRDADMVFDVRFLKNPYFVPELRPKTGQDDEVVDYLSGQDDYKSFVDHLESLVEFVMPRFLHEGKSHLTIAIGCTGGRHRSVALAERLSRFLEQSGYPSEVHHRDLGREAERDTLRR
jgi:UPF0042 nucleotide-binding protein